MAVKSSELISLANRIVSLPPIPKTNGTLLLLTPTTVLIILSLSKELIVGLSAVVPLITK